MRPLWQRLLAFLPFPVVYLLVRLVQGDPLTTARTLVAFGAAFAASVLSLLAVERLGPGRR